MLPPVWTTGAAGTEVDTYKNSAARAMIVRQGSATIFDGTTVREVLGIDIRPHTYILTYTSVTVLSISIYLAYLSVPNYVCLYKNPFVLAMRGDVIFFNVAG